MRVKILFTRFETSVCERMIELLSPGGTRGSLHRCLDWQIVMNSFVMIVDSHAQNFLRVLLANNVLVQVLEYLLTNTCVSTVNGVHT